MTSQTPPAKRKVLVVDDSTTSLMLSQILIGKDRYTVMTARDGQEAVEVAQRELPDVILMDLLMPRMDGIEACKALRKNGMTREIPIIMVTTQGDPDSIEACRSAGCTEYVTKPITGSELLAKLRKCLGE
jgi:CheY-like chemotaxis protein